MNDPPREFISEPIQPVKGSFQTDLMAMGLASLPAAFIWRGERYEIEEMLSHCKQSSPEGGVEGRERYLRRQQFEVRLHTGQTAVLYLERQPRRGTSRKTAKQRWFLYAISSGEANDG